MKGFAVFGKEEYKHGVLSDKTRIQMEIVGEVLEEVSFCFNREGLISKDLDKETFWSRDFYLHSDNEGHLRVEYIALDRYPYAYDYGEEDNIFVVERDPNWVLLSRKYATEVFSFGLPDRIYAFDMPREVFFLETFRILLDEYLFQWDQALEWLGDRLYFFEAWAFEGDLQEARLQALGEEIAKRGQSIGDLSPSQDLHEEYWKAYEGVRTKKARDLKEAREGAQNKDLNYPNPKGVWIGADLESRSQVKAQVDQVYQRLIHCPQIDLPDLVFSLEGEGHFAFNQDIRLRHKIKILGRGYYPDYYVTRDPFLREFYQSMGVKVIWEDHFDLVQVAREAREEDLVSQKKIRGSMVLSLYGKNHESADLALYEDQWTMKRTRIPMKKEGDYFTINLPKRLFPSYYNFIVDGEYEVVDPYAKALSQNNRRGYMFIDKGIPSFKGDYIPQPAQPAIYEVHVKDFTIHPSSGAQYPGTFHAMAERGLRVGDKALGFDYLVDLGIDYVHLMPVHNFLTMWEQKESLYDQDNYNWGYDPDHYFALENSYGPDPADPLSALRSFRALVDAFHKEGIGVIMDVVYNHLYLGQYSDLAFLERDIIRWREDGYPSDGAGTGTENNSENPYMRQVILDSIAYYQDLGVDGFRFDLAALTDRETFFAIEKATREKNPHTLLYGEPWMAAESTLAQDKRVKTEEHNIYFFDDWYRNALKGTSFSGGGGYLQGDFHSQDHILNCLKGLGQHKNNLAYFSCHDDYVILDYLDKSLDFETWEGLEEEKMDLVKLAFAFLAMTPMPIIFHEGDELFRRRGKGNPYNGPLENVELKWDQILMNSHISHYIKDLFHLRRDLDLEGLEEVHVEPGLIILKTRREEILVFNNRQEALSIEEFIDKEAYICGFDERGLGEKKIFQDQILPSKNFYYFKKK